MSRGALSWRSRRGTLRLLAALLGAGLFWSVLAPVGRAEPAPPEMCGENDSPEPDIQGDMPRADQEDGTADQGYNCGVVAVAYDDLGGLGGGAIARAGHCIFTDVRSGGGGIRVIDVADPLHPTVVHELEDGGGSENMYAVVKADGRAVLSYGPGVWDVTECIRPWTDAPLDVEKLRLLGQIQYTDKPIGSPHNIKLSPDGTKVVGTMPLTIADISNLDDATTWDVKYFQCEVAQQVNDNVTNSSNYCMVVQPKDYHALVLPRPQLAHEPEFNADGTRLYIAGQTQQDWFRQDIPGVYQRDEYLFVLDMTGDMTDPEWPKVLSETFGGGHGINSIHIGGKPYLLHSNEGGTPGAECKGEATPTIGVADSNAAAYLTDISDERAPLTVSTLKLDINNPEPEECAAQLDSNLGATCRNAASAASRGCVSTVHYQNVDNAADATFAMLSMTSAGLRIWDIRNPEEPKEVAYWSGGQTDNTQKCVGLFLAGGVAVGSQCGVPAGTEGTKVYDPIGSYAHYDAATGYIFVNTRGTGFWVLKLEPQVREALGLPHIEYPEAQPTSAPAKHLL